MSRAFPSPRGSRGTACKIRNATCLPWCVRPGKRGEIFRFIRKTYFYRASRNTIPILAVLYGLLLGPAAVALNPELDISQYTHTAWTLRDGSFQGYIESIAQTPDGYLWLGTEFGLVRFDGVHFVVWQAPQGQRLPDNFILRLLAARDGSLWIGTRRGLARLKDGQLTNYPELTGERINVLLEDRSRTIWAGREMADPALQLCAIKDNRVLCDGSDGKFGKAVFSLYEDSEGNLWVGAETGLWRWKPGSPKLYPARDFGGQINGQIPSLIEVDKGTILVATRNEIKELVNGRAMTYDFAASGQPLHPNSLLRDRNGGLWIATLDQGLWHVHEGRTDRFTEADGLSGNTVSAMFEDREGDIWVATTNGLDRFRDSAVTTVSSKQGLSDDYVQSVLAAQDGSVWLATLNGLNRWKDGRITIYRRRRPPAASRADTAPPVRVVIAKGLPSDVVQSLFQDSHGNIFVSTRNGLARFDNGRFSRVSANIGIVVAIAGNSVDDLWVSDVSRGLLHLIRGSIAQVIPWSRFGGKYAESLVFDSVRGGIWLGLAQGGVSYFKDGHVRESFSSTDGLGEGPVSDLRLDSDGTLWASTHGGLSRLENRTIATLTDKDGLPCSAVRWSIEDNNHSLWAYTACGLVRISRPELDAWAAAAARGEKRLVRTTAFYSSDGVSSHLANGGFTPPATRASDGRLWFATFDGAGLVDPRQIPFNAIPPPVHIEQVTADGKMFSTASLLHLPPLVRDLRIDFTAPSLVQPEQVQFRYMLEGRDRNWQDAGNRREAFFTDLHPGKYRFRVSASNNSGLWNEVGASLDFSIAPAYYQTNWFRLACVALFAALLLWLYRVRLHQIALQFELRLEERVAERTRIAGELHDTLLQGFQGLMLRFQTVDELLPQRPLEAKQVLEVALDHADRAITEGRDAVHDLRSSGAAGKDLAQAVAAIGEEFARNDTNAARFHMVLEGTPQTLHLILQDEIYRIVREALWNAFKHARSRLIESEITYGRSALRVRIRDDGVGIDPAVLGRGGLAGHWGLPGMRERAKRIGGQLEIWSRPGAGTEIELTVPGSIAYRKLFDRATFRLFRNRTAKTL